MADITLCAAIPLPSADNPPVWLHVLPSGLVSTQDGRGPYRVTDAAGIIAASMAGGKLVLDENHATDLAAPMGLPAPARGWLVELQQRADGIWGRVDWTPDALKSHVWQQYRGISPAIAHRADGTVTSICRASLVNTPNLIGLTTLHAQHSVIGQAKRGLAGINLNMAQEVENLSHRAVAYQAKMRLAGVSLNMVAAVSFVRQGADKDDEVTTKSLHLQQPAAGQSVAQQGRELSQSAVAYQARMAQAGVKLNMAQAVACVRAQGVASRAGLGAARAEVR